MVPRSSFLMCFVIALLLSVATASAQDIRGDEFIALTRDEKVTFIQRFADEYAAYYDAATAEQIRDRYHIKEPKHDFPRGVSEAIGYSGEILERRNPHDISMKKVLARVLEIQFGPPTAKTKR